MTYVIFDDRLNENFFPVTLNRSTGDIRLGILKLRQRIAAYLEIDTPALIVPSPLEGIYKERHPDRQFNLLKTGEYFFINSRLKISDEWVKRINSLTPNSCYTEDNMIIAARCNVQEQEISSESIETFFADLKKIEIDRGNTWQYIWELINHNADFIKKDFEDFFYEQDNYFETEPGVTVLNPYNVWIGEGTELKTGVVIDASEGPVVIDEKVKILSNSVITGPVYIGKNSLIKAGSKIYEGTSIGPRCKIGGEIENTIFQGYTNKQHDGFLGHSYLGEWINLGAGTNNSDLKNNYQSVKSHSYPDKRKIDTGSQFLGAVIGDHSKTGINCSINTGCVIGIGCNLYGHALISDFVPSFSWGEATRLVPYRLASFLETAEMVKQRRDLKLSDRERDLFTILHRE